MGPKTLALSDVGGRHGRQRIQRNEIRSDRDARPSSDPNAESAARRAVDDAKRALGDRGPYVGTTALQTSTGAWVKNTRYAEW